MKRIYFLVPDFEATKHLVDELLLARIEERRIHVVAKRDTPLGDLPEASFLQKTDFIPSMEQGLAVGGITGTAVGLVALAVAKDFAIGSGIFVASFFLGAGLGAVSSSMIGSSTASRRLKAFGQAIEHGQFLVMVDVAKNKLEKIETLVKTLHPEVENRGIEPLIPAFP